MRGSVRNRRPGPGGGWRRRDRKVRPVTQGDLSVRGPVFMRPGDGCRRAGPTGVRAPRVAKNSRKGEGAKGAQEGGGAEFNRLFLPLSSHWNRDALVPLSSIFMLSGAPSMKMRTSRWEPPSGRRYSWRKSRRWGQRLPHSLTASSISSAVVTPKGHAPLLWNYLQSPAFQTCHNDHRYQKSHIEP